MFRTLAVLSLFISSACADTWSGVHTGENAISTYKVHLLSPNGEQGTEHGYVIAQGEAFGTCYIPFTLMVNDQRQIVLAGLPTSTSREIEGAALHGCGSAGWAEEEKVTFRIDTRSMKMDVFVEGNKVHTLPVIHADDDGPRP